MGEQNFSTATKNPPASPSSCLFFAANRRSRRDCRVSVVSQRTNSTDVDATSRSLHVIRSYRLERDSEKPGFFGKRASMTVVVEECAQKSIAEMGKRVEKKLTAVVENTH